MSRPLLFRFVSLIVFSLLARSAIAGCSGAVFTPAEAVRRQYDSVLIVVHASSQFDPRYAIKHGLDSAVRFARANRIPVIYLADDSPLSTYFMDDCAPDYWVRSESGELPFELDAQRVFVAGGHLENCLSQTIHDLLMQAGRRPERPLEIVYFMDAIYSNAKSVAADARYAKDVERFMEVVTYGRPHGEQWPKISLLELVGAIRRLDDVGQFLRSILPHWERGVSPRYRGEIEIDGLKPSVLRSGGGLWAPTLRFRFVESADSGA